ncbi:endosome sorting protein [Theileria orientalis]|uniref:Endosome sorting protein n=1 Tax=Theileria orientalis TaxID=68886 RepID=A0A976MDG7_THEOR|nr:endosome sorting protein [Theileria orientalis]
MVFGFRKNKNSPVRDVPKSKKECVDKAIECNSKGDRATALGHLKRKKLFTDELNKLRVSLLALESQNIALEGAQMQHMALSALTNSLNAQKYLQSTVNSTKFEDLIDDLEETKEVQQEVFDTMAQTLSISTLEFEDELDQLAKADGSIDKTLNELPVPPNNVKVNTNQRA